MVNKVIIMGRLAEDGVIRQTKDGSSFASIVVVTSEDWTDREGEKKTRPEFHRIAIFNKNYSKTAELKKGTQVYVEGRVSDGRIRGDFCLRLSPKEAFGDDS